MALTYIRQKADLIYGRSGLLKTSNIGYLAKWIWKKYRKVTRLITCDLGGYDPVIQLVEDGIIQPWVPIRSKTLLSTLEKAMEGWWPENVADPDSPLAPPEGTDWNRIGAYGIEGLTSFGDQALLFLQDKKAVLSQDPSYQWSDGDQTFSGANMAYFGLVQTRLYKMVMSSHVLPVEKVLWTALEGTGEEDRIPVYGPAIVGRKSTGKAPQWFGNTLHIEGKSEVLKEKDPATGEQLVQVTPYMFTRTHADPVYKMNYPCKHRAPIGFAGEVPTILARPDITFLYDIMDELNAKAHEQEQLSTEDKELLQQPVLLPVEQRPKSKSVGGTILKVAPTSVAAVAPSPMPIGEFIAKEVEKPAQAQPAPVVVVQSPTVLKTPPTVPTVKITSSQK